MYSISIIYAVNGEVIIINGDGDLVDHQKLIYIHEPNIILCYTCILYYKL
jgi:hypothetical protein